jgi:hypothetical protein
MTAMDTASNAPAGTRGGPTDPEGSHAGRGRAKAGASSLGKNDASSYHHPPEVAETLLRSPLAIASETQRRNLRRLDTAAAWDDAQGRITRCRRVVLGGYAEIRPGPHGHYLASLMTCGQMTCPACAPARRWRHEERLKMALRAYQETTGGIVRMATLTVPHRPSDSLAELLDGLTSAWGRVVAGRRWSLAQERLRLVGWLRAIEVTVGSGGWHPHCHVLLLAEVCSDDEALSAWLAQRWLSACLAVGMRAPSRAHGVDVRDVGDSAAGYLLATTTEAVRADIKRGRGDHRLAPFQLLDLAGTPQEPWARKRWLEYVAAMRGRHSLVYSRGLRAWLAHDQLGDERDVPKASKTAPTLRLTREQWRALRASPEGPTNALALLNAGRTGELAALLDRLGPAPLPEDHLTDRRKR